ncbi:MAG: hypothetical protein IT198_14160 [Acidimicrobiia bacterium]|nr:hypothetical protein [Acidimicrobiia bacterium]
MSPRELAALCLGVLATATLVVLSVARWLEKRRVFGAGDPVGTGVVPPPRAYPPSIAYLGALWLVLVAIGLGASTFALVTLGLLGAAASFRLWIRGGMALTDDALVLGQGEKTAIPYDDIVGVVSAPRGSLGRSRGTFGIAHADGSWCAAIRYQTISHGARGVAELVRRAGLRRVPDAPTWTRTGRPLPLPPFPFVGAL